MNLTSIFDYVIATIGFIIIAVSFGWNIYDVFLRKAFHTSDDSKKESASQGL